MNDNRHACVKYKGSAVPAEIISKQRIRHSGKVKAVAVWVAIGFVAVITLLIFAVNAKGFSDGFCNLALKIGLGAHFSDGKNDLHEPGDNNGHYGNAENETLGFDGATDGGHDTSTETEGGNSIDSENTVTDEMSMSGRGDGYCINYTSQKVDTEGLLAEGFGGAKHNYSEEPVVMIVHSYTSSGYCDMDPRDKTAILKCGVVAVGAEVAEGLTSQGVPAIHVTVIHDGKDEKDPYSATACTVKAMLDIYPSVRLVIDLGRMDVRDEKGRLIKLLSPDGEAQIRVTATVANENWRDDTALALVLRRSLNDRGKKRCLPITLSESKYSVSESEYYLKIDVGTVANSSSEAMLAANSLVEAIVDALKK